MVDYQSRYRLYSLGYTCPYPRESVCTQRELKHDANRLLYKDEGDRPVHDCRPEFIREMIDKRDWEVRLLSRGMKETYSNIDVLHRKNAPKPTVNRDRDKMLLKIGELGDRNTDFHYPRGVICTRAGDIVVADSHNHRVQVLNQAGLYKIKFGTRGSDLGQFEEPMSVCELPNGLIAVADRKNQRIQVFSIDGKFKYLFNTENEPYSVVCDKRFNCIVATAERTIEIYSLSSDNDLALTHSFKLDGKKPSKQSCPTKIPTNSKYDRRAKHLCPVQIATYNKKIIVCDPFHSWIKFYRFDGELVYMFQLNTFGKGLAMVPSGITVNLLGEIIVSDSLNHTVNLYSSRGDFIRQVIAPVDAAGSIHAIAVGPEGHLVVTESSVKGDHCVKIFRYNDCECHKVKPPSSRKRTPLYFAEY